MLDGDDAGADLVDSKSGRGARGWASADTLSVNTANAANGAVLSRLFTMHPVSRHRYTRNYPCSYIINSLKSIKMIVYINNHLS